MLSRPSDKRGGHVRQDAGEPGSLIEALLTARYRDVIAVEDDRDQMEGADQINDLGHAFPTEHRFACAIGRLRDWTALVERVGNVERDALFRRQVGRTLAGRKRGNLLEWDSSVCRQLLMAEDLIARLHVRTGHQHAYLED
jgi:hypothetical protein